MVSNSLDMTLDELVSALQRLRQDHSDDPDYQEIRRDLPAEWPM